MKITAPLWVSVAALVLTGCSAAPDPAPWDDEVGDDAAEGAEAEPAPDDGSPPDCPDCPTEPGAGGADPGEEPLPDTVPSQACYPGADGSGTTCLALVPWSSSWGTAYQYPSHSSAQYAKPLRFIDLSGADAGLRLSPNFTVSEVMQEWKGRYGIYQPHVIRMLQQIRDSTGGALYLNSAYRSPGYNRSVDGATYSRHMFGDAADMRSAVVSLSQLKQKCQQLGAGYIGMYTTFIHCDWRNHTLEPAFFSPGTASLVDPDDLANDLPVHTAELVPNATGRRWRAPATGFDEGEPLRVWTAYDGSGTAIDTAEITEYSPPTDATRLRVEIGGNLELEVEL